MDRKQYPPQYLEALAPVAQCMLDEARLAPGQRVLEIGSGDGAMAVAAATRVGPAGRVLATDLTTERLAGVEVDPVDGPRRAPIDVAACAAEQLSLPAGSFDAALARNCVMYFSDLDRALRNLRVALRPGARCVVSVYGALDREPFHAIPLAAVRSRCTLSDPLPQYALAFALDAEAVQAALRRAGFGGIQARPVAVGRTYDSIDELMAHLRQSHSLRELMSHLPPAELGSAWAEIEQAFLTCTGPAGLRIPGEQVVVTATA